MKKQMSTIEKDAKEINVTEGFERKEKYYGTLEDLKLDIIDKLADDENWEDIYITDEKFNIYPLQQLGRVNLHDRMFYLTVLLEDYQDSKAGDSIIFEIFEKDDDELELDIIIDDSIEEEVINIFKKKYKILDEGSKNSKEVNSKDEK